jgi:hypothetical protein
MFPLAVNNVCFNARAGVAALALAVPGLQPAQVSSALAAETAAKRQRSRVEITGDRTPFSQTFANPDGTAACTATWTPQRVKQGTSWVTPDATLVQGSNGSWLPAAAVAGLTPAGGGSRTLATLISPPALPTPSVSRGGCHVRERLPQRQPGGHRRHLRQVRRDPGDREPEPENVGMTASSGLARHKGAAGSMVPTTFSSAPVFRSPPPAVWNPVSAGAAVGGPGPQGGAVSAGASHGSGSARLGGLSASSSGFPMHVDPPYSVISTELATAMVASGMPATADWNPVPSARLGAGYRNSTTKAERSCYRLTVPSQLYGATFLPATLNSTANHAGPSASASHTVNACSASDISAACSRNTMPAHSGSPQASATPTAPGATPNTAVSRNLATTVNSRVSSGAGRD